MERAASLRMGGNRSAVMVAMSELILASRRRNLMQYLRLNRAYERDGSRRAPSMSEWDRELKKLCSVDRSKHTKP